MEVTEGTDNYIFALDIGTRSIIGMTGKVEQDRLCITAIEKAEHGSRAMVDGQIEDIAEVARVAALVKKRLEDKTGLLLDRVHVAAAGRALRTQPASYEVDLEEIRLVSDDEIRTLENGAINKALEEFEKTDTEALEKHFYLVGYSVCRYYLDNYPISNLQNHKGRNLKADVIATFLPGEVVESLYTSMQKAGMEIASMTLEPIASMNAAVPQKLRLLNLVLVDIGAGTSDISVSRDGSIAGYTMATTAGDEVTECLMRAYLTDFDTAEYLKIHMEQKDKLLFHDVLGIEHSVTGEEVRRTADQSIQELGLQIAERILDVNNNAPSAVFLTGGGSKLSGLKECIAEYLEMDENRVALGGNNFSVYAYSEEYDLKDPELATPLGIAVSAALNLINDSYYVRLNGQRAKLFRSGKLTIRDILMMNGYGYKHMISRSGQSMVLYVDGERIVLQGGHAMPAVLTLNGQTAMISDLVQAGDDICFEPAQNGEAASVTLKDVVSLEEIGKVYWNGGEITLGTMADVNGVPGAGDMQLHTGDVIKTCKIYTAEDLASFCQLKGVITVNGSAVPPDWKLEPGDMIDDNVAAVNNKTSLEPGRDSLFFRLNGKRLDLPLKDDKTPYYLIDMLSHVDLDLTKPEGIIMLRVNGLEAGFQTELKNGDNIDIYWSLREN